MFLKFLKPYDRCTSKLILLLFASTRALLIPVSIKFSMYSSCRLIFLLNSTNDSIFDLLAHDIQFFNSEAASLRFCSFKMFLNDSFNSYPRYNLGSLALICASLHSPEKRNGSSGLTARRSASVERCKMAVTRD